MEWKLSDLRKAEYDKMLRSAQDLEMSIGSNQYRIYKLTKMREDIDVAVKKWWDELLTELKIDSSKDYMISEGSVKEIVKPGSTSTPVEVKPSATSVSDLK